MNRHDVRVCPNADIDDPKNCCAIRLLIPSKS
jgi:hypothetical protein